MGWIEANTWLASIGEAENELMDEMGFEGSEPYLGAVLSPRAAGFTGKPDLPEWTEPDADSAVGEDFDGETFVDSHMRLLGGGWD